MSEYRPLSKEELNEMAGEELPERAAMSLVNANVAIPINAAVAANVLSDNATAPSSTKIPPAPFAKLGTRANSATSRCTPACPPIRTSP